MKALLILPITLFLATIVYYSPELWTYYSVSTRIALFILVTGVIYWCAVAGLKLFALVIYQILHPAEIKSNVERELQPA